MTGVAGKTGVPHTSEQWEAKRAAGRLGGAALAEKRRARRADFMAARASAEPEDPTLPPEDIDGADLSGEAIPVPSADLADYPDGEGERQLAWARHWTAQKALQTYLIERGRVITVDVQAERERAYDELILAELSSVLELATSLVPADQKPDAKAKAKEWLNQLRERLAQAIPT